MSHTTTAVLVPALSSSSSPQQHHHHHHSTNRRHLKKMIPHSPPPPPSHAHRSWTTTTTRQHHNNSSKNHHHHHHHTTPFSSSSPQDDRIRRGAQLVRLEISSRPYDDDDDVEITTEDHDDDSVTSWSHYDVTIPMTTTTTNRCSSNKNTTSTTTMEIDPPSSSSMADWSVDVDDDDLDDHDPEPPTTQASPPTTQASPPTTQASPPTKAAHHHHTTHQTTKELGFTSSDDDDDDHHSDIVEIHDAWLDPFASPPLLAAPLSPDHHHHPTTTTTVPFATISSQHHSDAPPSPPPQQQQQQQQQRSSGHGTSTSSSSHSSSNIHQNNNHSYNNSDSDGSPYRHRTVGLSSSPTAIRKAYPLPLLLIQQQPKESSPRLKHSVDRYQDHDDNDDNDDPVRYHSPEHAVREVPIQTPSTVSNLSSPGGLGSPLPPPPKQSSSAMMMKQYDALLRDPAYRHAQNAGFIWQSIVGQHIRFPGAWWNGARGPPIHSGYDDTNNNSNNIPWMYFGRHTITDHPVLNQLVKCRASAGRLLLHIVVLDLMTRTPIQDIVIGCFHPNSKGIRSPNSPPLKRYENCRDIWMAVRKRNHTAVAATDSLIYSPSHWENPRTGGTSNTTSAYQYSISRSPLGSGQRVTNVNVRAVFGDKAPLETIFLSEDELYERLAHQIVLLQQPTSSRHRAPSNGKTRTDPPEDRSPALTILQELVFA